MSTPKLSLLLVVVAVVASSAALSGDPAPPPTAEQAVHAAVIKPLLDRFQQRAMFSRARLMPPTYKVEMSKTLRVDASGAQFRAFKVTADGKADLSGCAYEGTRAVYLVDRAGKRDDFVLASTHPRLRRVETPFADEANAPPQKAGPRAGACVAAPANA